MTTLNTPSPLKAPVSMPDRLMLLCGMVLLAIWPIEGTLALRNLLLFIGGSWGMVQIYRQRHMLRGPMLLPLKLVGVLGLWVVLHYLFLTQNSTREMYHLKHSWLPSLFAATLGTGIGLIAGNHRKWAWALYGSLLAFLLFFYINYFQISYSLGRFTMPYPWDMGYYGNKISIVVFGMFAIAMALSLLAHTFQLQGQGAMTRSLGAAVLLALGLLAFLLVGTKNGIALGSIVIGIFVLKELVARRRNRRVVAVLVGIVVTGVAILYLHARSIDEWDNFSATVKAGFQTEKYDNWSNHEKLGAPVLADGTVTKDSAYVRTAYAVLGTRFLLAHPLGYGSLNDSFKYLVKETYPEKTDTTVVATLSGWLDFGLAMGVPGLALLLACVGSTFFMARKQDGMWATSTMWIMVTLTLAWLVAEVCDDVFLESMLFLVCLFAAGNLARARSEQTL